MAKSQDTFNKKEKEKKRLKKRLDKQKKKDERKSTSGGGGGLDSMMAYVDEYGNITDTPPDRTKITSVNASSIVIGVPRRTEEEQNPVKNGKVEFYNDTKGFGFIKETETQEKYFVHVRGLLTEIRENDLVTFELERGLKGMNAVRVKKV